jgi:hypothetical protein
VAKPPQREQGRPARESAVRSSGLTVAAGPRRMAPSRQASRHDPQATHWESRTTRRNSSCETDDRMAPVGQTASQTLQPKQRSPTWRTANGAPSGRDTGPPPSESMRERRRARLGAVRRAGDGFRSPPAEPTWATSARLPPGTRARKKARRVGSRGALGKRGRDPRGGDIRTGSSGLTSTTTPASAVARTDRASSTAPLRTFAAAPSSQRSQSPSRMRTRRAPRWAAPRTNPSVSRAMQDTRAQPTGAWARSQANTATPASSQPGSSDARISSSLAGAPSSAPVGQAPTHAPQPTQGSPMTGDGWNSIAAVGQESAQRRHVAPEK